MSVSPCSCEADINLCRFVLIAPRAHACTGSSLPSSVLLNTPRVLRSMLHRYRIVCALFALLACILLVIPRRDTSQEREMAYYPAAVLDERLWLPDGLPRVPRAGRSTQAWAPLRCSPPCKHEGGYCDASLGVCVCAPGWRGPLCEEAYLSACRTTPVSPVMACSAFASIMSCDCHRQCSESLGRASVAQKACFIDSSPEATGISNPSTPTDHSRAVSFWVATSRNKRRAQRVPLGFRRRAERNRSADGVDAGMIQVWPAGIHLYPSTHCPGECSGRGMCGIIAHARARSLDSPLLPVCQCHVGYEGSNCETETRGFCLHSCNDRGKCVSGMCVCSAGWSGIDCSTNMISFSGQGLASTAPKRQLSSRFAPMFVYPLPHDLQGGGFHHMYQGGDNDSPVAGANGWTARGVFEAERAFLVQLHAHGHTTANPEAAALFFVPSMLTQLKGNLWEPQRYLSNVIAAIRSKHPYWNRSNGADHVFFTTQDLGGCWISPEMRNSIIVSHFGFVESLPFWQSTRRWAHGLKGVPPDKPLLRRRCSANERAQSRSSSCRSIAVGDRHCQGRLTFQAATGCYDPLADHLARTWQGQHRWHGVCYNASKDVVVPVDFKVSPEELSLSRQEASKASWANGCTARNASRKHLIFMSGSVTNTAPYYSQGVRKAFYALHRTKEGVVYRVGSWRISDLRDSTFCLCPSGWGYGWRLHLAMATLCIPVIIQPMVEQAYHDLLPYHKFALTYSLKDVKRLPQLLRKVSPQRICALRANVAKYYRLFMWQQPDGLAYEALQLSLCRRAVSLHRELSPPEEWDSWTSAWASACNQTTIDDLLEERAV